MNGTEYEGPEALTRRSFLQRSIWALGGLVGAALSGLGLGYFVSPALRGRKDNWVDLGRASDFKPGSPKQVEFVERRRDAWATVERRSSAWVLTADGKAFTVFDPRCTHLGCPYRWDAAAKQFLCPCHTAVFGMDGRVVSGPPPRPLDRYQAKVAGGRLLVLPVPQPQKS